MKFRVVFFILAISIAFFLFLRDLFESMQIEDEYFSSLNLVLKGVVQDVDRPESSNGFGILEVSILNSNLDNYDPRNTREYYYCIIKNGKAEIYQCAVSQIQVGDTVEINTRKKGFKLLRNDSTFEEPLLLYDKPQLFNYAKKYHQRF
jgi:hypothetical protein